MEVSWQTRLGYGSSPGIRIAPAPSTPKSSAGPCPKGNDAAGWSPAAM